MFLAICFVITIVIYIIAPISQVLFWILLYVSLAIYAFLFGFIFLKPIQKFTQDTYSFTFPDSSWEFFQSAVLKHYLNKEIDKEQLEETLDFLISRLNKKLENENKRSFLNIINSSVVITLSLFIPVWSAFNSWIYTETNNFEDAFSMMLNILFSLFTIILILNGLFKVLPLKNILNSDAMKISSLIDLLEIIRFSHKKTIYYKEIDHLIEKNQHQINLIIEDFFNRGRKKSSKNTKNNDQSLNIER